MKLDINIRKQALHKALKEMGVKIDKESLKLDTLFKINYDKNKNNPSVIVKILFDEFLEKENINRV